MHPRRQKCKAGDGMIAMSSSIQRSQHDRYAILTTWNKTTFWLSTDSCLVDLEALDTFSDINLFLADSKKGALDHTHIEHNWNSRMTQVGLLAPREVHLASFEESSIYRLLLLILQQFTASDPQSSGQRFLCQLSPFEESDFSQRDKRISGGSIMLNVCWIHFWAE